MPTREFRKLLPARGCTTTATAGSHEKWTAPGGHSTGLEAGDKQQKSGTLRRIQAALAPELGKTSIEENR
jgi:predicted RNA binding protein YcfA (HicA-like mRNA interferase family)